MTTTTNLPSTINPALMRAILLKIAFKPELMKRTEAAVLYVALAGQTFTADVIPGELREDNTTPGAVISLLARLGLRLPHRDRAAERPLRHARGDAKGAGAADHRVGVEDVPGARGGARVLAAAWGD